MINLRNIFLSLLVFVFAVSISAAQEKEVVFAISQMASPAPTISNYSDFIIPNPAIYYNAVKLKNQTMKATFLQWV